MRKVPSEGDAKRGMPKEGDAKVPSEGDARRRGMHGGGCKLKIDWSAFRS